MTTIQKKAHRLQEASTPLGEIEGGDANVVMNRQAPGGNQNLNQSNQIDFLNQDLDLSSVNFENTQDTPSAPASAVNTPKFDSIDLPIQAEQKMSPTLKTVNESLPVNQEENDENTPSTDAVQTRADGSTNIAGQFQLTRYEGNSFGTITSRKGQCYCKGI
jgi:hypothetical protein